MYIVVIAWFYVVVLMAVAEATSSNGTVLGAIVTFVLYGVLPLSIVVYILGTPGRRRKLHAREMQERAAWEAQVAEDAVPVERPLTEPDAGSHASGACDTQTIAAADTSPVAPVRKEP